ncbi:hypothetical protein [Thalassospira australica]|uniref:hypothetical protein n=1 Tax=Thalassospira australica TaxID=1528106 RepID=UPI00384C7DC3
MSVVSNIRTKSPILRASVFSVAGLMALSACSFTGTSDIENPLVRKGSWFSFINADDIRTACSAGDAEGRIRIVYNADYYKETRSFDLIPQTGSERFEMVSRIFGPLDVSQVNVEVTAPLGAFGGKESRQTLSRGQYLALTDALQADGFGYQSRDGLRLHSDDYYWVAIGCSSQNITLAAWTSAKDDLRALTFPNVIENLSGLEKPLPQPPAAGAPKLPDPFYSRNDKQAESRNFYRTVRGNQLR